MALPTSGQLTFEQVGTELSISTAGPHSLRSMSSTAGKSVQDSLEEFYGYSHATPVQPTKCSVQQSGSQITAVWFCSGTNDACQLRTKIGTGSWSAWQDQTSPYTITLNCFNNTTYYMEARGRIGSNYSTACSAQRTATGC